MSGVSSNREYNSKDRLPKQKGRRKMMKKRSVIFAVVILAIVCAVVLPTPVRADNESVLTFELSETGKEYIVTACDRSVSGEVVIPSEHNGLPVTCIGESAFYECKQLTSVVIPDSVTTIERTAFSYCYNLKDVNIPNTVTSFGDDVFYECGRFSYNIYENAMYLGDEKNPYTVLVMPTSRDITQCQIHPDTKVIARNAFSYCNSLTEITIPDGVVTIGEYAFSLCDGLTSVTIPDSITYMGASAFWDCVNITQVHISDLAAWC